MDCWKWFEKTGMDNAEDTTSRLKNTRVIETFVFCWELWQIRNMTYALLDKHKLLNSYTYKPSNRKQQ